MRILIGTGLYPPAIGGIATFAASLEAALRKEGHTVTILTYDTEHSLPPGIRHAWYFLRAFIALLSQDAVIALDTMSTGLPALTAAAILRKRSIIRIGGDFLWESFVARTGAKVSIPDFYATPQPLDRKERLMRRLVDFTLARADMIAFTTTWQKRIWESAYAIPREKSTVIENVYGLEPHLDPVPAERCFLFAGRPITLKNIDMLKEVFQEEDIARAATLECLSDVSHEEVLSAIKRSYAIVLPSYSDVSPNIILEGIKAGKPFVITKHNGISERIANAGIEIDPFDKESLRKGILRLCEHTTYEECRRVLEGIRFVHTADDVASEYLRILGKE